MFLNNFYVDFTLISDFGGVRNYGLHEGEDRNHSKSKETNILNLFSGIVENTGYDEHYGRYITLKHNPKFMGGVNDIFYTMYCHLSRLNSFKKDDFIKYGTIIGKMGNTGKCMTYRKNQWEYLTEKEIEDPKETRGVHLHLSTAQIATPEITTKLFDDILFSLNINPKVDYVKSNKEIIPTLTNIDRGIIAFWQWNRLYIKPDLVCEYFNKLKELTPAA